MSCVKKAFVDEGRGKVGSLRSTAWVTEEAGIDGIWFSWSSSDHLKESLIFRGSRERQSNASQRTNERTKLR